MRLSVKKIVELCDAEVYCGNENVICTNLVKDTRNISSGDTFIGIKGENYNGNDFYMEAFSKGANCVILEKKYFDYNSSNKALPIILVSDSIIALKNIASYVRLNSDAYFVGVTGSVGKTSTRDMIYSVLKEEYSTLKTENNYNNNIGLPLTITRLTSEKAAVIEMGMNHLGEISYLSNITKPNIGVITNVGTAHIGELGSRENILKAKLEIIDGMDCNGILVINNDNDLLHNYYLENKKNIITIGITNESDFMAKNINLQENSSTFDIFYKDSLYNVFCPLPGIAFVYNSLVAFAVGTLLNVEIKKIVDGIKNIELTKNRMEIVNLKNNIKIINGVYNASVDSMKSNLEILVRQTGNRKIAVLGDMLELGDFSKELHEEVGKFVFNNNIDILITVGSLSKNIAKKAVECGMNVEKVYTFDDNDSAINLLKKIILPDDTILFKASHSLRFDEIVNAIIEHFN